jgi:adenosylmethionine-8-amino-7-oxononanoate aminotransferase
MSNKSLKQRDLEVVWHPFNQMKGADILPIASAKGAYLFDENGNKYIDAFSSWWVNVHGHCHPDLVAALTKQAATLEHVAFGGFTHQPAVELAEGLIDILPDSITRIFYSDNGSTSTEVALKMTLQYFHNLERPKTTFVAFENGYHGDTFGSMSVTARGGFNEPFESLMFDVIYIPTPTAENIDTVKSQLNKIIEDHEVAGFIFEPIIQGAGGMLMHSPEGLSELIGICKDNDVICIADEVMTGFGRTGKMFATDHLENKPDIMCLSKAITGGFMAMGITAVTEKIYQAFYSDNAKHTFLHGHSYTGNTLACALGVANLELFKKAEVKANLNRLTKSHAVFVESVKDLKMVRAARSFGTIVAIDIESSGKTSYFNGAGQSAYKYFLDKGIVLRPLGNTIAMIPPYCVTDEELNFIYSEIKNYLTLLEQ